MADLVARTPFDAALRQIAFIGFPKEASPEQRVAAMERFMKHNFPSMQIKHIDVSLNREGHMTTHGYVEVGSKQHARLVTSTAKSRSLTVPGFDGVRVKPENTEIDRNRNWALNKADQLIKKDDRAVDKLVEKKLGKDRGIYVDGVPAFVQRTRYSKGVEFVGNFANLRLP